MRGTLTCPANASNSPAAWAHSLAGRLDTPDHAPRAWAVFAHCFTCSKDTKAAAYIAQALAVGGYGVLHFEFAGLGGSGGDFANTNFIRTSMTCWLRDRPGAPTLLICYSLGSAAVLAAAGCEDDARAVVTLGAPFDPAHC